MRAPKPVGKTWCPRCFAHTEFYQGPGHAPEDDEGPIRCWECDYEYGMIMSETDEHGTRLAIPLRRWAITKEQRQKMIREMRQRLWDSAQGVHQHLHRIGPRPR